MARMVSILLNCRSGLVTPIGSRSKRITSTMTSGQSGKIKVIVPEGPDHPNALLDACLAFYPRAFAECASIAAVQSKLARAESLDFHMGKSEIPQEWHQLRSEALGPFRGLHIFEAARMISPE